MKIRNIRSGEIYIGRSCNIYIHFKVFLLKCMELYHNSPSMSSCRGASFYLCYVPSLMRHLICLRNVDGILFTRKENG